jgi:chloramphenicol 3-O-phosphotransferase
MTITASHERTVLGFHRAVAGMVAAGNDIVMDHILGERRRLADRLSVFHVRTRLHQAPPTAFSRLRA